MVVGGRCWATACVILFLCVEEAAAFAVAPMGAGVALRRRHELRSTEATVSLQLLRSVERTRRRERPSARRSMAVQAAPGEKEAEAISETLQQTVIVEASMDECFQVASDLDNYRLWCRKGGMKKVNVLERLDCGKASKVEVGALYPFIGRMRVPLVSYFAVATDLRRPAVSCDPDCDGQRLQPWPWQKRAALHRVVLTMRIDPRQMTAGKLGVDMLNTMEYSYAEPNQVIFNSIEGDVMKTLNGRYIFAEVEGASSKTEVTYELALEFGFPLPEMVRSTVRK